jgi:hypothetical protein
MLKKALSKPSKLDALWTRLEAIKCRIDARRKVVDPNQLGLFSGETTDDVDPKN